MLLLVGVLATVFILVDLLPGNAATQRLGSNRTEEALAAAEIELGLDKPVHLRFAGNPRRPSQLPRGRLLVSSECFSHAFTGMDAAA